MYEIIASKIYKIINFTSEVDYLDPDYVMICSQTRKIPQKYLYEFYEHLVLSIEYYKSKGTVIERWKISKAVNDFLNIKYDIDNKSSAFYEKIIKVASTMKEMTREDVSSYIDSVKLKDFYIKDGENKKQLFTAEEIKILTPEVFKDFVLSEDEKKRILEKMKLLYREIVTEEDEVEVISLTYKGARE